MVAVNLEPSVSISPSFGRAPAPLRRLEIRAYAASPYPLRNPNPPTRNSGETSGMTPALAENSVLDPDLRQLTDHVSPLDQNSPPPAPAPGQSIIGTPLIPAEVLAEPGQASDLLMATPNSNVPLDIHALGTTLGMDMAMYCDTQGLIHLHQQDQWLATVMFFQSVIRRLDTMADARVATILPAMAPGTIRNFNYHPDVRAMIKNSLRECVLRPTLHAYGRTQTVVTLGHIALTPLVIVKAELDARDTTWKQVFLPPGYSAHQPEAITSVKAFIRELLKYEKSTMAKLLLVGLKARGRGSTHDPVPRLDVMIVGLLRTMSPEHELQPPDELRSAITSTQRIRFGYLRVQMVIQRQQTPEENGVHSIWEVIDRHLESLRRKSADWKVAFARLVLSLDAQLFDGINTARDVRAFEVRMPSDEEVATELFARAQAPEVNDETPTTHVQEEIF
ncbi:hypothetical protein KEM48_011084 [Puccinia striiformis f. sp. tritici PST-130]|nr:hypothetical protein KEM48_011084 [Puccinia striiformis f. sp. tritici PST-130]